jgi:maleylacetoacetate isomerase/maleylpyruvate isomerase
MRLHNYFRSGTSFRVRIALHLKGLPYDYVPVNLLRGEHREEAYRAISPDGLVPLLELEVASEPIRLTQSMAIIEYLEEAYPTPPLMPADCLGRARVRAMAQTIACEVHPVNNQRILQYLGRAMQASDAQRTEWYNHWVTVGLQAYERRLEEAARDRQREGLPPSVYSYGAYPTLADCCLVPQIVNGRRFSLDIEALGIPLTLAVFQACMRLDAFVRALPDRSPDAT